MTAMMLLGKLRQALGDVLPPDRSIDGMKKTILKELLWGSVQDIARILLGVDTDGVTLPTSATLVGDVVIEYCGG